jgi:transcriptional regulator with GAF, ATPase, and Fis domain
MEKKILIVEDESLVAFDLKLILTRAGYQICGIADSVKEALEIINEEKPELVLLDIFLKGPLTGIDLARDLTAQNIAFVYLSANFQESILDMAKSTQPYGFLVKPFRENELLIVIEVAFYRHRNSMESRFRREFALEEKFKAIEQEQIDWRQKLRKISSSLQPYLPFDYLSIILNVDTVSSFEGISFYRTGFDEYQMLGAKDFLTAARLSAQDLKTMVKKTPLSTKTKFYNNTEFREIGERYPIKKVIANTFQMNSFLNYPLLMADSEVLTFSFYSRKNNCYTNDHLALLSRLQQTLTNIVESILKLENSGQDRPISLPVTVNNQTAATISVFDGIIGNSHQILTVQDLVSVVAPLDTSVLILGESGTGKERIAKSIHNLSPRRTKPLIIVNCASLPATLIESELFGHEKGAFTGANEKRIGKFELADKGTVFLDEIGEMHPELQVKLLRVLQEQEIERIGGKAPIKINVRIIAATNRVLEKEVEEGRFRLDLYYRLYVFPITIPPLRERIEDLPLLVKHFIHRFSLKSSRSVTDVSPEVMDQLRTYHWPGNVRELEHLIERTVLLTNETVIRQVFLPKPYYGNGNKPVVKMFEDTEKLKTIDEISREHILTVLKKCEGRIGGKGGAAEILDIQPTTLHSRIKKLGIKKEDLF